MNVRGWVNVRDGNAVEHAGMGQRVRMRRGILAIESAPGQGTQVRARVPIPPVE